MAWAFALLPADARTWTAKDGRTLEAEFVETDGETVTLRRSSDGKRFALPLAKLSEADREWVAEKSSGPADKSPGGMFQGRLTGKWEKMEFMRMKFRFYGGPGLDPEKRYPLVLCLHANDTGSDNERQLTEGFRKFASSELYKTHPSLVLVPQCPNDGTREKPTYPWEKRKHRGIAIRLVREAMARLPVDEKRVYLATGGPYASNGAFEVLENQRTLFAAAILELNFNLESSKARALKSTAFWITGRASSRKTVEALSRVGAKVKFVESRRYGQTFEHPEVFEWLFSQRCSP